MRFKIIILFFGLIMLISSISALPPQDPNPPQCDCSSQTNPLSIKIIELNQSLNDALSNLTYYINQSDYYQRLYESKEVNVTHRELIQIYNTLNNFELSLADIKNKFSIFTFQIGLSIIGLTGIGVSLVELTLWYFRRRKKKHETTS